MKPTDGVCRYFYRVVITDKRKKGKKYLAEVIAENDETARRKIVHQIMSEGGLVKAIMGTEDKGRYPGESSKRFYDK